MHAVVHQDAYNWRMRTTVDLDDDTAKAVEKLRREEDLGLSEAVNHLIRRGLIPRREVERFEQPTRRLGLKIDVSNVAEALEVLEGVDRR